MKRLKPFILSLLFSSQLFAWGGQGHQIVALIAEDRLTPKAQQAIHELLGKDVDISDAEIASWADEHRREDRKTGPWHYVDIPVDKVSFDRARDGNKGANVIDKIVDFQNIISDKNKTKDERTEALKYLVHFVGDIHQPLHTAERDNDSGGNKVPVTFLDEVKPSNLHTVWDSSMIRIYLGKTKIALYSSGLSKQIKAADAKEWAKGTPVEWANESHKVALESVYKDVPVEGTKYDQKTVDGKRKVIELQLERGGVRLATVLNNSLDPKK